jgi:GT2 family glycosyltransferase
LACKQGRRVLVIIVNYRTAQLTINCLRSLEAELAGNSDAEVVVVDNASGDAAVLSRAVAENGWGGWAKVLVAERNGGFAYGNNVAIRAALQSPRPPDYFLLLNSDTEVFPGAVCSLLDFLETHPEVGIGGSSFENADGSPWPIAFRFIDAVSELESGLSNRLASWLLKNRQVVRYMKNEAAPVDWVPGASMLIRREVVEDIGLLDETYFLYYEEVDFCLRARRAGWPCWYVPHSHVMHIAGQSTGVSTRGQRPRRVPAYYFESRRHYFLKNFGRWHAMAADLAFGLGRAVSWLLRRALMQPDNEAPNLLTDFWRHSVFFNPRTLVGVPRNAALRRRCRRPDACQTADGRADTPAVTPRQTGSVPQAVLSTGAEP